MAVVEQDMIRFQRKNSGFSNSQKITNSVESN